MIGDYTIQQAGDDHYINNLYQLILFIYPVVRREWLRARDIHIPYYMETKTFPST
jgi:hypothetical protein